MIGDRQDALRYRWLRERLYSTEQHTPRDGTQLTLITFLWPDDEPVGPGPKLGAAIDRILRAERK